MTASVEGTGDVCTVKVPLLLPAAMLTDEGTVADLELLDSSIVTAFAAGPFKDNVPAAVLPPTTDVGETLIETRDAASTTNMAVFETEPLEAVIVTGCELDTAEEVMGKLAEPLPAATTTDEGTLTVDLSELSEMVSAEAAKPLKATVPEDDKPPTNDEGLTLSIVNTAGFTDSVAVTC